MKTCKQRIAKHDPAHCLAPGLFASLPKGGKRQLMSVKYKAGNSVIEFTGPQLGADDLRVLQGLVSLATRPDTGKRLGPTPTTELGQTLRAGLETTGAAATQPAQAVKATYKAFFDEVAMAGGGKQVKALRACLRRLYAVTIFVQRDGKESGHRLLNSYESDSDSLVVALNPLIAAAIGGRYIGISMSEVRAIKSDPARLIHQRLCGYLRPAESTCISLDVLTAYAYLPTDNDSPATQRKRRHAVRSALSELAAIGWHVGIETGGNVRIGRP